MSPRTWSARLAWCLAAAAVVGASSDASAQRGQGRGGAGGSGRGGFGGPTALLGNEQVQEELKLTDDQKSRIEEVSNDAREKGRELFGDFRGLQDLSEEERRARMDELQKKMEPINAEAQKKIDAILNAEQRKRLQEISLQQRGNRALTDEKVAKELGLDAQQVATIKEAIENQQTKMRELMPRGGFGRGGNDGGDDEAGRRERFEKMRALREETEARIADALTEAQAKKFEEMKGERFEMRRGGFGRGGEGGPGRQNRGGNAN